MSKILKIKIKGSLTVEVALVFPLVIITLLFIANILNICMVHLLMQHALNNTVKSISQNSYIIYRFSEEEDYFNFINKLNDVNIRNDDIENDLTISKFNDLQNAAGNTIETFEVATHSFEGSISLLQKLSIFATNVKNLMNSLNILKENFKTFTTSVNSLIDIGSSNIEKATLDLMLDDGSGKEISGNAYEYLFKNYVLEMGIPASKISDLQFNSSIYGKYYKLVVSYYYTNPFSFVNNRSMEYSVINKKIKMTNIINIRPFIGNKENSFKNISEEDIRDFSGGEGGGSR